MAVVPEDRLAAIQKELDERRARRAAARAEAAEKKKAFWDEYYDQLSRSTQSDNVGGGVHRRKVRVFRLW